ncbi:hypothetical protein A2U01_0004809, partial [Trifolium medium]|nr:hypothetical protein [Trifolium medium]
MRQENQRQIDWAVDLRLNGGAPKCDVEVRYRGGQGRRS